MLSLPLSSDGLLPLLVGPSGLLSPSLPYKSVACLESELSLSDAYASLQDFSMFMSSTCNAPAKSLYFGLMIWDLLVRIMQELIPLDITAWPFSRNKIFTIIGDRLGGQIANLSMSTIHKKNNDGLSRTLLAKMKEIPPLHPPQVGAPLRSPSNL